MNRMILMTAAALLAPATIGANALAADIEAKKVVLTDKEVETVLRLDASTVRCSAIGYGLEELKISVPVLHYAAIFNHANPGESQPCMTAGACAAPWNEEGFKPEDLIRPEELNASAKVRIVLTEEFILDHQNRVCERTLVENVTTEVRGIPFKHRRNAHLGTLPFERCLAI